MENISMTKLDLIEALAEKEKMTDKQATDIVNLIMKGFTDTLKRETESKSGVLGVSL